MASGVDTYTHTHTHTRTHTHAYILSEWKWFQEDRHTSTAQACSWLAPGLNNELKKLVEIARKVRKQVHYVYLWWINQLKTCQLKTFVSLAIVVPLLKFNSIVCILLFSSKIRYSSRASLQLNAHTRTCLGEFVIKLTCCYHAVQVHLAHASTFIVHESWTSAFNECECCISACECSQRTWRSCSQRTWRSCCSSSLLPSLKTTTLSSIGGRFKLVRTQQIIE